MSGFTSANLAFLLTCGLGAGGMQRKAPLLHGGKGFYFSGA